MKAISTFIAAIMLVAFTVAAGVLLSTWFTTFTTKSTAGVGGQTQAATACSGAIQIMYVRNGSIIVKSTRDDVKLTLISVVDSEGNLLNSSTSVSITTTPVIIYLNNSNYYASPRWMKVIAMCSYKNSTTEQIAMCFEGEDCWGL